jgi:hypothetical protein
MDDGGQHALVHVGLIGFLVPADLALATPLLAAPFRRHLSAPAVERGIFVRCGVPAMRTNILIFIDDWFFRRIVQVFCRNW